MPKAVATKETTRVDLKTCPGGFVELRKFTYGEMIKRREISSIVSAPLKDNKAPDRMDLGINQTAVQLYEYSHAIMEHNLEDEDGRKLNFANAEDVLKLDPQIAGEIEAKIDQMNQPPESVVRPLPESSGTQSTANGSDQKSPELSKS